MSKSKKTTEPVEAVVVEDTTGAKVVKPVSHVTTGAIFWGLSFIFVGGLLLLDNLGVVSVHFSSLFQLLPLLIIGAGVSMLSLRGWVATVVALCMVVIFATLAVFVSVDNSWFSLHQVDCNWRGSFEQCFQRTFDPSHWR